MRVLVTRPREDAAPLAAALAAEGHETLIQPLLRIEPADPPPALDFAGVQALLFTSANGVRALAALTDRRDLPVFAVGDASAEEARRAGFAAVESAAGDVEDLARLVSLRLRPADGVLFHGAGASLAGDLKGALAAAGFALRRVVLYKAVAAGGFAPEVREALAAGRLDAVLLFSPRSAETFVTLTAAQGLADALGACSAVCLSAAVAERVGGLPWRRVAVARRPDRNSLLACLKSLP